jgi:small-conductance mechanosensitive channel
VTLKGHGGRVSAIGPFHIRLVTPDDDLVCIPTSSLWTETLISSNAGDRASLCIMPFYLAPFATREQCQKAEDAIWDAVQASTMFDFSKPLQIYIEQTENAVRLTAKAYVANTYEEPLFKSDVVRAFLTWAADNDIPLASTRWREERQHLETET